MSATLGVERFVPGLRRYARACVGEQRRADECVMRALERALAPDPALLAPDDAGGSAGGSDADWRRRLYGAVYQELRQMAPQHAAGHKSRDEAVLGDRIRDLDDHAKHSLLLHVLESFATNEIAAIMDLPEARIERCIAVAYAALRAQPRANVLILEDDELIAADIAGVVAALGHDIIAIAATAAEALAAARGRTPDLVLADVELRGDETGIDAVRALRERMNINAIFVTGFPERVLSGEAEEPVFVLSKPFDERLLQVTMAQALRTGTAPASA